MKVNSRAAIAVTSCLCVRHVRHVLSAMSSRPNACHFTVAMFVYQSTVGLVV